MRKRKKISEEDFHFQSIFSSMHEENGLFKKILNAPNVGISVFKAIRGAKGEVKDFQFEYTNKTTQKAFGKINPIGTMLSAYGSDGLEQLQYFKDVVEQKKKNSYIRKAESGIVTGWFLFSNALLGNDRVVQVWEDITELKKTELALLRLKEDIERKATNKYLVLFNAINQGVAHCKLLRDKKGNAKAIIVDEVNIAWERIMGIKPENVLGKDISEWLPNLDKAWIAFCQRVLDSGHPESYEASVDDLGGKTFEVFLVPLENDYFMALCTDTTARRKEQEELEKAIIMRDEFIYAAAHELKTPITTLKMYAQFLASQQISDKGRKYFTTINNQIDKMTLLINDLLNVTKIQTGKLEFTNTVFNLTELIKEVVKEIRIMNTPHKIIIQGKIADNVFADRNRVSQVISNLLLNAIKYSTDGKEIHIHLSSQKDNALVTVQDFGIGIAKKHHRQIFKRFYRVNDTYEKTFPGLGLGLYISNEIVQSSGGDMSVVSKKGKGSEFSFTLPYHHNNR